MVVCINCTQFGIFTHPSLDHAQELQSPHLTYSTSTFDLTLAKVTIISERQLKNKLNRIESNQI